MSLPINQQKQLIKKYYDLLVEKFIQDPLHKKDISIVFKNHLGSSENSRTLGRTEREGGGSQDRTNTTWQEINRVKVPGSEKTTTTATYFPYKYTISFLNNYQNEDQLRGAVVHEFTHHYLYSTIGKHNHDDNFYSTMERLESWLDKNQGLNPRTDKSHDRDQYENDSSSNTNDKKNICPECSWASPHHAPQCSHNQNKPQQKPTLDPQQLAELSRLEKSLQSAVDLEALEVAYQNVKSNPLYQGESHRDNQGSLDTLYKMKKQLFQAQGQQQSLYDSNKRDGLGKENIFLIILIVIMGVIFLIMIGYLVFSKKKKRSIRRKRF